MSQRFAKKRHARMLDDPCRTPALLRAVKDAVRPGDTVLDIGTGLGILAIAAAKAGARHVWACDVDASAMKEALHRAAKANVLDQIEFMQTLSFDLKLPSRADVIICETVGSFAFDENILATLADAKNRLLKRGGRIIPQHVELWGALIDHMTRLEMPAEIGIVKPANLLSKPLLLATMNSNSKISDNVHVKTKIKITRKGTALALAVWPRIKWSQKEISDASPLKPPTHWKQGILTLEPRSVAKGESVGVEIIIGPHPDEPYTMTERLWKWENATTI